MVQTDLLLLNTSCLNPLILCTRKYQQCLKRDLNELERSECILSDALDLPTKVLEEKGL